jgi:hypothetical protein
VNVNSNHNQLYSVERIIIIFIRIGSSFRGVLIDLLERGVGWLFKDLQIGGSYRGR